MTDVPVADLPVAGASVADPPFARPYGLVGMPVSLAIILILATFITILVAALAFAVAGLVLGWHPALELFAGLKGAARSEQAFLQRLGVVVSLVFYAAVSAAVVAVARFRAAGKWRDLIGWRPWSMFRGARLFWLMAFVAIVYSFGADAIISRLYPPSTEWVTLPSGKLWASLFVILAVLFAPVAEELVFRGWIYTSLRKTIGIWAGILISSVLFALAHWESTHLYALAVFPVGLILGFIRERTGSLKASMTMHALYNGAASVLLVFGS